MIRNLLILSFATIISGCSTLNKSDCYYKLQAGEIKNLKQLNDEVIRYYSNSRDDDLVFYNKKSGNAFINIYDLESLSADDRDQELMKRIIYAKSYVEYKKVNNLTTEQAKQFASKNSRDIIDHINHYYNLGNKSNSITSKIVASGYANSSHSEIYKQNFCYVANLFNIKIKKINSGLRKGNLLARSAGTSAREGIITKTKKD